jgi:hypothetical protein
MNDSAIHDKTAGTATLELMYGQWVGTTLEEKTGEVRNTLNIEKRLPRVAQILTYIPQNPNWRICTTAPFQDNGDMIVIESPDVRYFDLTTGNLVPIEEFLKQNKIEEPLPKKITYQLQERGRMLIGSFENDTGQKGTFKLVNTIHDPAAKADHTLTWENFKEFVTTNYLNRETVIFRGQPDNTYKLRTSFHRCQRNNLLRYMSEDVPKLRHAVNAVSSFYYPPNDFEHLGGLLSLGQHHGYPTPLLDWTFSPYIAAFFAFTESAQRSSPTTAARIFIFDYANWPWQPSPNIIIDPLPTIQFLVLSAHNNPRFVPQQSIASFSNVDDIESWIRNFEKDTQRKHLTVIDIPISERRRITDELRLMGITAGSLFPGIDGLCRSLKEKLFRCD